MSEFSNVKMFFGPDKLKMMARRDAEADEAWEKEMKKARRPKSHPKFKTYIEVVPKAIAAYDAVIAKWRGKIWR